MKESHSQKTQQPYQESSLDQSPYLASSENCLLIRVLSDEFIGSQTSHHYKAHTILDIICHILHYKNILCYKNTSKYNAGLETI